MNEDHNVGDEHPADRSREPALARAAAPSSPQGQHDGLSGELRSERPAEQDFAAFFEAIWTDLAGYGHTLTGNAGVGDELAQEALTRVYARYALLRDPRPYAFRVVTNLARDRWKTLSKERDALRGMRVEATTPGPDGGILDAVQRLRAHHREVLLLHYWGDMSIDEIASVLHRPTGTVKRWLAQARLTLSASMGGQ